MTDDFTPIEFSWTWGNSEGMIDRRVRFSIEAISEQAGTVTDPWNQKATFDLVSRLESAIPGIDLERFYWLSNKFIPSETANDFSLWKRSEQPRSCMFLAFELGDGMPVVKAYMLPYAKQVETGQSSSSVIFGALHSLAYDKLGWPSLQVLVESLEIQGKLLELDPFMIATDCITPSESRMKVYARSINTSLSAVQAIMSMFDGKIKIVNGLDELRKLWRLVFSLTDDTNENSQLPYKKHDTSGILYYFEARPGSSKITTKVYLPVRHYGRDDLSIATGLQTFFKERRGSQDRIFRNYLEALHQICTYRRLDSVTGLQTYISCKIENDSLDITSYLSPEIYHKDRSPPV
jgi:DMATS type aromatic prenyltransferase